MIKSEKGSVVIDGGRGDLIIEFKFLYESMIEEAPEIVAAVIINHEQELATAVESTEAELMHVADILVKAIIKAEKELE